MCVCVCVCVSVCVRAECYGRGGCVCEFIKKKGEGVVVWSVMAGGKERGRCVCVCVSWKKRQKI